ncbi:MULTISPECIES: hypothetical protein [Spirulina sp. CCY15215]|uniref:hypothetical protein n=1 Tax=Spirulina sp. CCY15215 TaxID=2767591 RepID=UPI00194E43DA|nr:hypothetical protein [Spirulina major]
MAQAVMAIADKLDPVSGINGIFESNEETMTAPLLFVSVAEDSPNYRLIEDYKAWQ